MTKVHIIRVFTDEKGKFGNPVGIVFDEQHVLPPKKRQSIATKLGFSETVFINSSKTGEVSIFNPQQEVPFAGHALVGTAWLLAKTNSEPLNELICQGKHIKVYKGNDLTWVAADESILPPWNYKKLSNAQEVEKLTVKDMQYKKHTVVWAWIDQGKGLVRARTFASDWGIPEDEANGSGSMKLANNLGFKDITIRHGRGSVILVKTGSSGIAVGGKVAEDKP